MIINIQRIFAHRHNEPSNSRANSTYSHPQTNTQHRDLSSMPGDFRLYDFGRWILDGTITEHVTIKPDILENKTSDVGDVRLPIWLPDFAGGTGEILYSLLLEDVRLNIYVGDSKISTRCLESAYGWRPTVIFTQTGRRKLLYKDRNGLVKLQANWDAAGRMPGMGDWVVKVEGR
jgi:hypothetical protein